MINKEILHADFPTFYLRTGGKWCWFFLWLTQMEQFQRPKPSKWCRYFRKEAMRVLSKMPKWAMQNGRKWQPGSLNR